MRENKVEFVTYSKRQSNIIKNGINAIREVLRGTNISEKKSLLLCLDKYIDPYYGYNLPYHDDICVLLQEQLFLNNDEDVKNDILDLLNYSQKSLDYLADKIELLKLEPKLLSKALYALWHTCDNKYLPIFLKYENNQNDIISCAAKDILSDILEIDENYNP
ncbi:hypothetical protein UT300005_13970 [Clostridium sp. CTA-5]